MTGTLAKGMATVVKMGDNLFIYLPADVKRVLDLKPGMRVAFDMIVADREIRPPTAGARFKKKEGVQDEKAVHEEVVQGTEN